jgi:hypothetical protein
MMAKNIETLAKKLGASIEGTVPDYSSGAFGMSALANLLRDRLELGACQRPAKPKPKLKTLAEVARFMRESFPEAQDFPDREQPLNSQARDMKLD